MRRWNFPRVVSNVQMSGSGAVCVQFFLLRNVHVYVCSLSFLWGCNIPFQLHILEHAFSPPPPPPFPPSTTTTNSGPPSSASHGLFSNFKLCVRRAARRHTRAAAALWLKMRIYCRHAAAAALFYLFEREAQIMPSSSSSFPPTPTTVQLHTPPI